MESLKTKYFLICFFFCKQKNKWFSIQLDGNTKGKSNRVSLKIHVIIGRLYKVIERSDPRVLFHDKTAQAVLNESGKNCHNIRCNVCNSLIIEKGTAILVERKVSLHNINPILASFIKCCSRLLSTTIN